MLPTVTDLTLQRLRRRLWLHWFQDKVPVPFEDPPTAEAAPALLKRSLQRRLLRAQWASALLWLLGFPVLYGLSRVVQIEARRRHLRQSHAPCAPQGHAIAIGNLILGGTGKTPLVIHLAKQLRLQGHQVAVLSRGYKRKIRGNRQANCVILGPDCRDLNTGELIAPEISGDEPWLIALRAGVPVGVGSDRYQTAQELCRSFPKTNLWLLDDGLSQTSLRPDARILLVDGRGLGNGHCLPFGPLRSEWTRDLADSWLRLSESQNNSASLEPLVLAHPAGQAFEDLFEAKGLPSPKRLAVSRSAACWVRLRLNRNIQENLTRTGSRSARVGARALEEECLTLEEGCRGFLASNRPLAAVAGIAQPHNFFENLEALGLSIPHKLMLPNHDPNPMQTIRAWMKDNNLTKQCILLTTEKDAVKLAWQTPSPQEGESIEWWALQLALSIEPSSLESFYGCKTT